MDYQLILGDCLKEMDSIQDNSIDMILADLPYGTTACKWDIVIPFEPLWKHYKRVIKRNGAIALFGSEPFSSFLRLSNLDWYKYDWVWNKALSPDFYGAKYRPLTQHENIIIFSRGGASFGSKELMIYNPIMTKRETPRIYRDAYRVNRKNPKSNSFNARSVYEGELKEKYPKSIIEFSTAKQLGKQHPTQKPVALLEYLIKTYTNEGETVLDNVFGSGSTGEACLRTGRKFIGIEKDEGYFNIATNRLEKVATELRGELNHLPMFAQVA